MVKTEKEENKTSSPVKHLGMLETETHLLTLLKCIMSDDAEALSAVPYKDELCNFALWATSIIVSL